MKREQEINRTRAIAQEKSSFESALATDKKYTQFDTWGYSLVRDMMKIVTAAQGEMNNNLFLRSAHFKKAPQRQDIRDSLSTDFPASYCAEDVRNLIWVLSENLAAIGNAGARELLRIKDDVISSITFCVANLKGNETSTRGIIISDVPSTRLVPEGHDGIYVLSPSQSKLYYVYKEYYPESATTPLTFEASCSYATLVSQMFPGGQKPYNIKAINPKEQQHIIQAIQKNTGHTTGLPIPQIINNETLVLGVIHLGLLQAIDPAVASVVYNAIPAALRATVIVGRGKLEMTIKEYIRDLAEREPEPCTALVASLPVYPAKLAALKLELFNMIDLVVENQARLRAEVDQEILVAEIPQNALVVAGGSNLSPANAPVTHSLLLTLEMQKRQTRTNARRLLLNSRKAALENIEQIKQIREERSNGYHIEYISTGGALPRGNQIIEKTIYVTLRDTTFHYVVRAPSGQNNKGTIEQSQLFAPHTSFYNLNQPLSKEEAQRLSSNILTLIKQRFIERSYMDIKAILRQQNHAAPYKYKIHHLSDAPAVFVTECGLMKLSRDPMELSAEDIRILFFNRSALIFHNDNLYELNPKHDPAVTLISREDKPELVIKKGIALFDAIEADKYSPIDYIPIYEREYASDFREDRNTPENESARALFTAITSQTYLEELVLYIQITANGFKYTVRTPDNKIAEHEILFDELPHQEILDELYAVNVKRSILTLLEETQRLGYTTRSDGAVERRTPLAVAESRLVAATEQVQRLASVESNATFDAELLSCQKKIDAFTARKLILETLANALSDINPENGFQTLHTKIILSAEVMGLNPSDIKISQAFDDYMIMETEGTFFSRETIGLRANNITYFILKAIAAKTTSTGGLFSWFTVPHHHPFSSRVEQEMAIRLITNHEISSDSEIFINNMPASTDAKTFSEKLIAKQLLLILSDHKVLTEKLNQIQTLRQSSIEITKLDHDWAQFRVEFHRLGKEITEVEQKIFALYDNPPSNPALSLAEQITFKLLTLKERLVILKTAYVEKKTGVASQLKRLTPLLPSIDVSFSESLLAIHTKVSGTLKSLQTDYDNLFENETDKRELALLDSALQTYDTNSKHLLKLEQLNKLLVEIDTLQGAQAVNGTEQSKVLLEQTRLFAAAKSTLRRNTTTTVTSISLYEKMMASRQLATLSEKLEPLLDFRKTVDTQSEELWGQINGNALAIDIDTNVDNEILNRHDKLQAMISKLQNADSALKEQRANHCLQQEILTQDMQQTEVYKNRLQAKLVQNRNKIHSPLEVMQEVSKVAVIQTTKQMSHSYSLLVKVLSRPVSLTLFVVSVAAIAIAVGILTQNPAFIDFAPYLSDETSLYGVLAAASVLAFIAGNGLARSIRGPQRESFFSQLESKSRKALGDHDNIEMVAAQDSPV